MEQSKRESQVAKIADTKRASTVLYFALLRFLSLYITPHSRSYRHCFIRSRPALNNDGMKSIFQEQIKIENLESESGCAAQTESLDSSEMGDTLEKVGNKSYSTNR